LRNDFRIGFYVLSSNVLFFQVEPHGLRVARISYRFLVLNPEIFSKLWDWSCFLELEPCKSDLIWCRGEILKVVLKSGSRASESLNIEAQEASARSVLYNFFALMLHSKCIACSMIIFNLSYSVGKSFVRTHY
jgi:hypothetical protein